jgi:selenocysteine-specific elongation factor
MHIIGTAGHVDHGKSALVRALTGTDPDRWAEEQRRGMTLDLGFAHLRFPDGREAGIVDVPGHERFLHNMLAGAAGMELVVLVVAANEGARLQTIEHLAILQFLNTRATLVALTKADLVDAAHCARAIAELRVALTGTIAQDAPIIPVSAVTGAGLPALRDAIAAALAALPPRAPNAPAYLPIDRVFARPGHGTVVTGTLMQGRIANGDALVLVPLGRTVRVRGLQVFGSKRETVAGGARVAVNIPSVQTSDIARGAVLASAQFEPAQTFAVRFRPLPQVLALLKRRTPVRAYLGSAEILGTLVFEQIPERAEPYPARLYLRTPTIAVPGAPFVVRRVSPMDVLGGGTVAATDNDEPALDGADDRDERAILVALHDAGLAGATAAQLGGAANIELARVTSLLHELVADGRARPVAKPLAYLAASTADELMARTATLLRERQSDRPWLMGMTSIALAQTLGVPEGTLVRVLATFVDMGQLAYRSGYYATTDFVPRLSTEQRAFFDRAFANGTAGDDAPIGYDALRALIRASPIVELSAAFETLVAGGALSKVGEFVYRGSQLATIRATLENALRRDGRLTVAEFRTLTGTSRKYAVPLLEFFDATGVTIRSGDFRVLRRAPLPTVSTDRA